MIMKCIYCEYGYDISPPEAIMEVLSDPDLPPEDHDLWMDRFVKTIGISQYQGILIHIGMIHKGEPKGYNLMFTEKERALVEHDASRASTAKSPH